MPCIHYHYLEFVHVANHYFRGLCQNYRPMKDIKNNNYHAVIHASGRTEISAFESHATRTIRITKIMEEERWLTVRKDAVDEVWEIDFLSIAARKASCDGRFLDDRRPLCANSARLRLADTSNNEWKGIALSNSSLAAAASMVPSGSEDSDISPTSSIPGIT